MTDLLDDQATCSIAEAAARVGVSQDTLRYYERDGLLISSPARSSAGARRYTEQDLAWIVMLTRLRATGMPIRTVRAYADLCRAGDGNERARLNLLHEHRDRVLVELATVREHLSAIEYKIRRYEGILDDEAQSA